MLDYRVDTFLAVCREGSYTKAAEALHITQPAVTGHIRFLEEYYGTKLILTKGRKIVLTPAAGKLKAAFLAARNDEARLIDSFHREEKEKKPLSIGVTVTIGEFVAARPLSAFIRNHEEYNLRVVITNTKELLEKLRNGEIQMALVEGYFGNAEFDGFVFRTERFIPAAASDYPFAKRPARLQNLFQERLLIREEGSGTREVLEKSLAARGYGIADFPVRTEINSTYAIIQFLKERSGISFLYEAAVREEIRAGTLRRIPLEDFSMHHDFNFIWNKGSIDKEEYLKISRELKNGETS